MKTIAIASQKGGVGKTTTALELYDCLNEAGYKTLLIDLDQQCNTTNTLNVQIDGEHTIYDVLKKNCSLPEAVQGNVVAGDTLLASIEYELISAIDGPNRLKKAMKMVEDDYDFCIIDTPPNLGIYLLSALVAADKVIIPVRADKYSIEGLSNVLRTISEVQENLNEELSIAGILLTCYDQRNELDNKLWLQLRTEDLGVPVFKIPIRTCQDIKKAQNNNQLLSKMFPKSKAFVDYLRLTTEIVKE